MISQENTCVGVCNFIKKRPQLKFAKFLKTHFLRNNSRGYFLTKLRSQKRINCFSEYRSNKTFTIER